MQKEFKTPPKMAPKMCNTSTKRHTSTLKLHKLNANVWARVPEDGYTRLGMTQNDCKRHQKNKGLKNYTETQKQPENKRKFRQNYAKVSQECVK